MFEIPQRVFIVDTPFTLQNGMLTATSKLFRRVIKEKYKEEIEKMYADIDSTKISFMETNSSSNESESSAINVFSEILGVSVAEIKKGMRFS
jgi:fatty acid CoA ligase FadD9